MNRCSNKFRAIVWLVFLLCPHNITYAQNKGKHLIPSNPQVLNFLPGRNGYGSVGIVVDQHNRPIAFSSYGVSKGNGHAKQILVYVFDNGKWVDSANILPGYPDWYGMLCKGEFQAYAINIPSANESNRIETVAIYGLDSNLELSLTPKNIIAMDGSKKVFDKEYYRHVMQLLPLTSNQRAHFIIGVYVESDPSLGTFFLRLISGGHGGYADRIFGAIVKKVR